MGDHRKILDDVPIGVGEPKQSERSVPHDRGVDHSNARLWRFTTQPLGVAMGLAALTLAPFAIAYHSWRFLEEQERQHPEPTPEMAFVFRFVANTPLHFGAMLLVVLSGVR